MEEVKKDVTQAQLEGILIEQFGKTQAWQFWLYLLILAVPFTLLMLWGFTDVSIWIRIPVYAVLGITLVKCENWVVARRVQRTIEAMKAL